MLDDLCLPSISVHICLYLLHLLRLETETLLWLIQVNSSCSCTCKAWSREKHTCYNDAITPWRQQLLESSPLLWHCHTLRFWMELGEYFEDGCSGITFRIEFRLNRLPLRYMHRAVDLVVEQRLENFLFPEGKDVHHQRKLLDKQFQ